MREDFAGSCLHRIPGPASEVYRQVRSRNEQGRGTLQDSQVRYMVFCATNVMTTVLGGKHKLFENFLPNSPIAQGGCKTHIYHHFPMLMRQVFIFHILLLRRPLILKRATRLPPQPSMFPPLHTSLTLQRPPSHKTYPPVVDISR